MLVAQNILGIDLLKELHLQVRCLPIHIVDNSLVSSGVAAAWSASATECAGAETHYDILQPAVEAKARGVVTMTKAPS